MFPFLPVAGDSVQSVSMQVRWIFPLVTAIVSRIWIEMTIRRHRKEVNHWITTIWGHFVISVPYHLLGLQVHQIQATELLCAIGFPAKHNKYFCTHGDNTEYCSIDINTIPLQTLVTVLSDMLITELNVKDSEIAAVTNTIGSDVYGNREQLHAMLSRNLN